MNSISSQFNSFFIDVKNFFVNLYNTIHDFLSQYLDNTALGIFAIVAGAALLMFIFRRINHD